VQANLNGQAAVASPDQYGALVAEQILRKGGNAVDAVVNDPKPADKKRQSTFLKVS
tara:strand:+ start:476 stop:643 length:168 start_codon:yes stop_codon:yes gene_type:complete